jgi:hypothetical protein
MAHEIPARKGRDRGETVTQIAHWRYYEELGYDTIADRLNADPALYAPPEPPGGKRARKAWGKTSNYEILRNPKYTGYRVFNRRASRSKRGKVNDPVKWVYSTPTSPQVSHFDRTYVHGAVPVGHGAAA